jgi:hypothetical protein
MAAHTGTYSKLYPFVRSPLVNGAVGAVVAPHGRLFSVMACTVTNGKITAIDGLVDPERLAQLDLAVPARDCRLTDVPMPVHTRPEAGNRKDD